MPRVTLSARNVYSLPAPASGRVEYAHAKLPGFCLRVSASGVRTFILRYSPGRGRGRARRRYTIGQCPPLEFQKARDTAEELLARLRLEGADPAEAGKPAASSRLSLADLATKYLETRTEDKEKPLAKRTRREYARLIKAHLMADAPSDPADGLARPDLRSYLGRVVDDHGPREANHLFALVRAACRWALSEDLIERNPADGIRRPAAESSRERVLGNDEIRAVWVATEPSVEMPDGTIEATSPAHAAAVRLQLLLGQRPTETLSMRWQDVDLGARRWTIPGAFRKGNRTHVVPLPSAALRILMALQPLTGDQERVLKGASLASWRWWAPIHDRAVRLGAQPFTRHDLRRTCATGCASLGAPPHVVSRILGHKTTAGTTAVTGIYDRFDRLPEIAAALNAWAAHVERINRGKKGADILALHRR